MRSYARRNQVKKPMANMLVKTNDRGHNDYWTGEGFSPLKQDGKFLELDEVPSELSKVGQKVKVISVAKPAREGRECLECYKPTTFQGGFLYCSGCVKKVFKERS